MSSCKPSLVALAILFLSLNQLSFSRATLCPVVNAFCNRKSLAPIKVKCINLFESDPRAANAPDKLTVFKIALEVGVAKVSLAEKEFGALALLKPQLRKTLDSCVEHYKSVVRNFNIYEKSVVSSFLEKEEIDLMSLEYDFDIAQLDAFNCKDEMTKGGIHDPALLQKAGDIVDYYAICYEITKVTAGAP